MESHDCTQSHPKHPGTLWLSLPAQTCVGTLSCVHMRPHRALAGWEAPTAGKAEVSSLSICFSLRSLQVNSQSSGQPIVSGRSNH